MNKCPVCEFSVQEEATACPQCRWEFLSMPPKDEAKYKADLEKAQQAYQSPNMKRDVFEFREEFRKRLENSGPYSAGTATLLKDKYDIEQGIFPLEIKWKGWVSSLNPVLDGFYINADRDFAKNLYESSPTHPLLVQLTANDDEVRMNAIILSGMGQTLTVKQSEDEKAWQDALQQDTLQSYQTYLSGNILKRYANEAQKRYEQHKATQNEKEEKKGQFFEFEVVTVDVSGTITHSERKQARYQTEDLGNGVTLEMVYIPGGTFMMGASETEKGKDEDEGPPHEVTVKPFYFGKYPITQAQWKAVMENNPSFFKGNNRPVERVLWHDAVKFCKQLSEMTGRSYRLPSEAEWECACRAGTSTPFHYGETVTTDLANYNGKSAYASGPQGISRDETTEVGSFPPNAFGLYDMHGNVYEWCADPWHDNYKGAPSYGRVWEEGGTPSKRLLRGGSWYGSPWFCRCATRNWLSTINMYDNVGFRVALLGTEWT